VAEVDKLNFSPVVVEGKKYRRDILILADGTVKERKGGILMFGGHQVKRSELAQLSQGQPELVVVDTGTDGAAHVAPEAESWARANNVALLVQPSYDALARLNELTGQKKRFATLIHITC
jgi:hypothetical protein